MLGKEIVGDQMQNWGQGFRESSKLSQAKLQEQRSLRLGIAAKCGWQLGVAFLILLLTAKGTYIPGVTIILAEKKISSSTISNHISS